MPQLQAVITTPQQVTAVQMGTSTRTTQSGTSNDRKSTAMTTASTEATTIPSTSADSSAPQVAPPPPPPHNSTDHNSPNHNKSGFASYCFNMYHINHNFSCEPGSAARSITVPSYVSDDVTSFTKKYTDLLNIIRTRSKIVYVCGDYNIKLLKLNSNNNYCSFHDNVLSSSLAPLITLPTRKCDTASTLIDNIQYIQNNVIDKGHTCDILVRFDHQIYFCMMNAKYVKPLRP